MTKTVGIVVVVLVVVLGLYFFMGRGDGNKAVNGGSAVIQNVLGAGKQMQCTYSIGEGEQLAETSVVIDNEKFMSTTDMADIKSYSLFDGSTQYTWTSKDKNGFKMSNSCLEDMKKLGGNMTLEDALLPPNGVQAKDMKDVFSFASNANCEAADVSITVPSDIVFTDQCELMKQSMRVMEELKADSSK
mgnify:CR=1 FL=1